MFWYEKVMYYHWLEHCDISTDRRNGRHMVKQKLLKLKHSIHYIQDPNIKVKPPTNKGIIKVEAQKYIYNKHLPAPYHDFLQSNPDIKVSIGSYYNCKPFYVAPASEREMEACVCIKCLNPPYNLRRSKETSCRVAIFINRVLNRFF